MKILIPMAGKGQRFLEAGYTIPKHLITVDDKPIIEHIVNNFSKDDYFIFGCNEEELKNIDIVKLTKKIAPKNQIVSMPYKKGGPIYGLSIMKNHIQDDEPIIVNYCDFSWVWNYDDFKRKVVESNCDGAIVCYTGFHPHLLGTNKYATVDENGLWMKEIREKYSWHKKNTDDYSSSGTYYFKKGIFIKKYLNELEKRDELKMNGELYVSQLFQFMKEDGLNILIYEIPYMLQWGTPEDLEEYLYWSDYFRTERKLKDKSQTYSMNILIPMAGLGQRFTQEGYKLPKPIIEIDKCPMVLLATKSLPAGKKYTFIVRDEFINNYNISKILKDNFPEVQIFSTPTVTEGQASTALLAKSSINNDTALLIGACDNSLVLNHERFKKLTSNSSKVDALIFTFRKNPAVNRNPKMYGWVRIDSNQKAINVSVKVPISSTPINDHAIVGTFWFRKGKYFVENTEEMIKANDRINNEFYIDNCMNYLIKNGLNVYVFEIDKYICWGTPNDLKTYEYWSKYFNYYYKN